MWGWMKKLFGAREMVYVVQGRGPGTLWETIKVMWGQDEAEKLATRLRETRDAMAKKLSRFRHDCEDGVPTWCGCRLRHEAEVMATFTPLEAMLWKYHEFRVEEQGAEWE